MSFCPKYINIRRGQLLAAVIGSWGFVPVSRSAFLQDYTKLITAAVENPRICRKVPCIPWRIHHFPGSHDINSHVRVRLPLPIQPPPLTSMSTNPFVSCYSYYIVRRGNVSVPDMYDFNGMYRYSQKFGSNWRAVTAFFIGCIPPLPGFVNNIQVAGGGKTSVSVGGQHL